MSLPDRQYELHEVPVPLAPLQALVLINLAGLEVGKEERDMAHSFTSLELTVST